MPEQNRDRELAIDLARRSPMVREGELEVDEDAVVSRGAEDGAYVQAWLWVDFSELPMDNAPEPEVGDDVRVADR